MEEWIQINNVKKQINEFSIGPFTTTFQANTITAIVGENGAGKSTFLKLLMRLAPLNEGSITIFNQNIAKDQLAWKKRISYQPQRLIGCDSFTGHELTKLLSSLYEKWDDEYFQKIVELFQLPLNKKIATLSPGVQQKLNLALTFARDTDIMLLDEPTSHMDIPSKQILHTLCVEWMERGEKLLILSSHQVEEIKKLADYILLLQNGVIKGNYEKDALATSYKRYWLEKSIEGSVPGVIDRKNDRIIVTQDAISTEAFFDQHSIHWIHSETLPLEEVLTSLLLAEGGKNE